MSESPNTAQVIDIEPVNAHAHFKRKYDGRANNGNYARLPKRGPKSQQIKALSQKKCIKVLEVMDTMASLAQIYQGLIERGELFQAAQVRFRVEDRLFGKPYVATNPDERGNQPNVFNDNRIQMAIQQLLPGGKTAKPRKSKAKELPAAPDLT